MGMKEAGIRIFFDSGDRIAVEIQFLVYVSVYSACSVVPKSVKKIINHGIY
jgi:hypothetical protein